MILQQLQQIHGHRAQIAALKRMISRGEPGHAYLFTGPSGVGKHTIAQAFLARLACVGADADNLAACGACRSCLAYARGEHPDIAEISKQGATIKIDMIRGALSRLHYDPVLGRIKGLILEDAETLTEEAANALLKTLEEPSSRTVFVLVSGKPQLLLETIRSRCQVLRFAELSAPDLTTLLVAEGLDSDSAKLAATLAEGSMTLARQFGDARRMEIVDYIVRFTFGLGRQPAVDAAIFVDMLGKKMAQLKKGDAANEADGESESAAPGKRHDIVRADLPWILDVLRAAMRDAVLFASGVEMDDLPHARYAVELRALTERLDLPRIMAAIDQCEKLEGRLITNPNPRLALQALLVQAGSTSRA